MNQMWLVLSVIMLVGGFLRGWGLNSVPPELFGDELDVGYQAYSLLKTGRDFYNQPLPLYLHSLSEWRLPLIVYQLVPTIGIFGLNEYGVRVPEAVMGILGLAIIFIFVYQITKNKTLSILSMAVLAILPWHIIYSRMAAFGAVTLLNFLMLGTILYLRKKFFWSAIFLFSVSILIVPL